MRIARSSRTPRVWAAVLAVGICSLLFGLLLNPTGDDRSRVERGTGEDLSTGTHGARGGPASDRQHPRFLRSDPLGPPASLVGHDPLVREGSGASPPDLGAARIAEALEARGRAGPGTITAAGPGPGATLSTLCEQLSRSDGSTDDVQIASVLDKIRFLRGAGGPAAETLSRLLPHRCKIYQERDKGIVLRLRAYVAVTLCEIGFPASTRPYLLDTLANVDEQMPAIEIGAAARAAGCLGPSGREFIPYLLRTLGEGFLGEEFSLERYDPVFPPAEATTVRIESVRALGLICVAEDREAVAALEQLATSQAPTRAQREVREAGRALARIRQNRYVASES